jgi:putative oxidoreductase
MERFLGRYEPHFYALLRIVTGFLFFLHGTQKLFAFPPFPKMCPCPGEEMPIPPQTFLIVVGCMELIFGLMVMLGFFTRLFAFLASGMMAVAYFIGHQPNGILPPSNGGDPAVLFCFIFFYIAARGAGILSIDAARRGAPDAPNVT